MWLVVLHGLPGATGGPIATRLMESRPGYRESALAFPAQGETGGVVYDGAMQH